MGDAHGNQNFGDATHPTDGDIADTVAAVATAGSWSGYQWSATLIGIVA